MKKIVLFMMIAIFLFGCQQVEQVSQPSEKKANQTEQKSEPDSVIKNDENDEKEEKQQEKEEKQEKNENNKKEDTDVEVDNPDDILVVVNKQRKLPEGYEPDDLVEADVPYYAEEGDPKRLIREVAAGPLEELFAAAKADGLELVAVSGYRSYDRQKQIYENNVAVHGQEYTDKYSAQPGTSEHQTGLAMDVASAELVAVLEQSFSETDEGQWLAEHAHEHGFIIRYLEGKEDITGYSYEPWHIRYVGKEVAEEIYQQQTTLEEYVGLY